MHIHSDNSHDARERVVFRTCPLCEATCGLKLTIKNKEVIHVQGDEKDVFSHGYLCPKGAALGKLHDDPDRLTRPLIRKGDEWREVSWEEAFRAVEEGLQPILEQYGRDAVAVFLGNPTVHTLAGAMAIRPFLKGLRSKNLYSASSVDQIPKHVSSGFLFGGPSLIPVPDLDRTDYLLILGANPMVSNGSLCTAPDFPGRLKAIRNRGGKVVVVDPCRTRTAAAASEHLFIRPGTDPFLLLGIVHTLFKEGLVALGPLEEHVNGVSEVKQLADPYSPDTVASMCGISSDNIRRLARELALAPTAVVYGRMGTSTVEFGTLASWLVDVVNVLTGNLDRPGGAMFPTPAHVAVRKASGEKSFQTGRWVSRVKGLPEVIGELPVVTLVDEIETPGEGQVRALVTVAGNPVLSTPNGQRLDRALASLDFMVCVDFYRNETTRHAHVILPPASPLAQGHYDAFFYGLSVRNVARYSPPVFSLEKGAMDKWRILYHLAMIVGGQKAGADAKMMDEFIIDQIVEGEIRKGNPSLAGLGKEDILGSLQQNEGSERMLDFLLRTGPYGDGFGRNPQGLSLEKLKENPHGIDLGPLKPRVPENLRTVSNKIELAPEPIVGDLPRLEARLHQESNEALVLIGRRNLRSNNSWMHNLEILVKGKERCTLQIHPQDARRLGLSDGGRAQVASRVGAIGVPVEITEEIMPGVVSLPHGWGHGLPGTALSVANRYPGINSNLLADENRIDPLSGNAVLNGIPVVVTPL